MARAISGSNPGNAVNAVVPKNHAQDRQSQDHFNADQDQWIRELKTWEPVQEPERRWGIFGPSLSGRRQCDQRPGGWRRCDRLFCENTEATLVLARDLLISEQELRINRKPTGSLPQFGRSVLC